MIFCSLLGSCYPHPQTYFGTSKTFTELDNFDFTLDGENRRCRMEWEDKAKVVTSDWGADFVQFLAALAILPWSHHRISIQQEGKRGGGRFFSTRIEPNWPLPYLRDAGLAGWVNCFYICSCTMPRAQNRAAEGSTLLWRRNTLTIWV